MLGKGESPFLKEVDYVEGHFRLTKSKKKVRSRVSTSYKVGKNPKPELFSPRIVAVFCIIQSFYCY